MSATVFGTAQYAAAPISYAAAPVQYAAAAAPVQYAQAAYAPTTMTMAAPTVMYAEAAPQVTYAQAAPQVAYAQAAPAQTYTAPVTTTLASSYVPQQQVTYAQAPITTQVASYVAQPQPQVTYAQAAMPQMVMPQMVNAAQVPMQPRNLTQGIPTPEQINQQKAGYSAALDKQLKEAIETVQKETAIEKEMIKFTAEKTTALYNMQVDEKLIEALAMADEQSTFALLELNKAKVERNLHLNSQASSLVMDYQMKAVQTELAQKQYAFQQTYMSQENKLAEQYNKQVALANTGTTYAAY